MLHNKILNKKTHGFTLLYASLIASLLLAVGLAILNITLEQLLLSSSSKESQYAFYNADTGLECAIYSDKNSGLGFATSSDSKLVSGVIQSANDIRCQIVTNPDPNGSPLIKNFTSPDWTSNTSATTSFDMIWPSNGCSNVPNGDKLVHIDVVKSAISGGGGDIATNIFARGYNTCDDTNPRRLERGFVTSY